MINRDAKLVLTGAAGLVGQNLVVELEARGYRNIVAIDKHAYNLGILKKLHPNVRCVHADLAEEGKWQEEFEGAAGVIQLHAQITGKHAEPFIRNNIDATRRVLDVMRVHAVPYLVHVSSSVVNSVAESLSFTRLSAMSELCSIVAFTAAS